MLPSMPIIFTRDSQDAFGNKIEPSTALFGNNTFGIPITKAQPPAPPPPTPATAVAAAKNKPEPKKQEPAEEKKPDVNTYETVLVSTYFHKVQSKFSNTRVPNNKFVQFREILKSFNPHNEDPIVLYKKIEELFGEEHKDLAEEFLMFLTPGQALTIGRYMDHTLLGQMNQFLECLHTTFARKPTMVRKVLRAVTSALAGGSARDMQARVLPHLRANPRLAPLYKALFPDEPLPESAYEAQCETLPAHFLSEPRAAESGALPAAERRRHAAKDHLDTVYMHGRVFLQYGRNLRPARVSFPYSKEPYRVHCKRLAAARPASPEPEPQPPKRAARKPRQKSQPKTKDVNDNKRKAARKCKKKEAKEKKKEEEGKSWTREEDKAMLEVLKGEAASAQVLDRIRARLPHRAPADIRARHAHVMALLHQMAAPDRA